ncbi:transient receptor potential-gamma protein-like isoform X2 [Periplaneta americana]|uniref:transient receptor potential-gamma protein-like isoform X2 n=1 Tax=Periplaneta americana TaxID=6978 RepID=UPI0037E77338
MESSDMADAGADQTGGAKQKFPRRRVRTQLSIDERKFLLAVQRGDMKATKRLIEMELVDKNCVDPMGRTALVLAIINEDLPMVKLLISQGVEAQDALLHAISEEFVEAVELLLDHEEAIVAEGREHSWEALPPESRSFSSDMTPLILAAQLDRFEVVRMLLDRGATIPTPHDVRCECCECVTSRTRDTVHHSRSRMNAFRALASPSLMCLTAKDPILTAFLLSWELRRLSYVEHEFRKEYQELKHKCKVFATALLDHTRSSRELEIILNYDPEEPAIHTQGRMHLKRLKLAVKLHQKEFVTHPNVQQLLASIWYEGLPGFRCKSMFLQVLETLRIAFSFPILSLLYIVAPTSSYGQRMKLPFIKFICHSASYFTFLGLLYWASQMKVNDEKGQTQEFNYSKRTTLPQLPEYFIFAWLCGMIKLEVRRILAEENVKEYIKDMWKVMDLGTNCLYIVVVMLRVLAYKEYWSRISHSTKKTQCWDPRVDAMVLSECLLAVANIFSSLRMIYIFSVSPYLGPMQVSLSRMVTDMVKFFLLIVLVLFAFSCGLNQLLWYYADEERVKCCESSKITETYCNLTAIKIYGDYENDTCNSNCELKITPPPQDDGCEIRMRFSNLFETIQTLFWTVFGVIDMNQFNLSNIESFTKFSAKTILGTYAVITNIVLLNLLIAMLNNSYQIISCKEDVEWKFARSKLWISYFDDKCTLPPPFNIFPTSKFLLRLFRLSKCCLRGSSGLASRCCSCDNTPSAPSDSHEVKMELLKEQESNYEVMRHLVRRYIMMTQQGAERGSINEDDINELKQDISAFRCELIDILQQSGYSVNAYCNAGLGGRKTRQRERRMMKDLDVIPTRESLIGLWADQPAHLQQVLVSATAPVLAPSTRPVTSVGSAAMAALKKKRKRFFTTSKKNREISRVGSLPVRNYPTKMESLTRVQSVRDRDGFTTQSSTEEI